MALINCSECEKQVSDKAVSCPNCGNPINKPSISIHQNKSETENKDLLRCPKCNSSQLTSNKKGFSGGKAVAGVVLTGGIGLLAGTIGSGNVEVTCLSCGFKYKAGDYMKEKSKIDQQRKISANNADSSGCLALGIIIFSLTFGFISYKLFDSGWILFGIVTSIITVLSFAFAVFGIYTESKKNVNK